ncbi:MAG: 2OG-Fe dioxygenase family protein, partial [Hyphomicrobiaceae bacterium]
MTLVTSVGTYDLEATLQHNHFAFVGATDMRGLLERARGLDDWDAFASSWDDLPEDTFMADGGRYRQRRHAAFAVADDRSVVRKPAQPHYQSRDRNPLNGGIERWFEPVVPDIAESRTMASVFGFCRTTLATLRPEIPAWHVETHQFRILARTGETGQPTPEGMHRDGVDFVLVLLVNRHNVVSGTTSIADLEK